jgi:hypothetical protein
VNIFGTFVAGILVGSFVAWKLCAFVYFRAWLKVIERLTPQIAEAWKDQR